MCVLAWSDRGLVLTFSGAPATNDECQQGPAVAYRRGLAEWPARLPYSFRLQPCVFPRWFLPP